jgi:acetyl esterase/lipase
MMLSAMHILRFVLATSVTDLRRRRTQPTDSLKQYRIIYMPSAPPVKTFHYGPRKTFESSLDVYYPSTPAADAPLVVIVVGSAWLGHRAVVYGPTSWWNSSGPAGVAALGCVCVAIRHRGAFIRAPPIWAAAALAALLFALMGPAFLTLVWIVLWLVWALAARGAATHDEMMDDVASALVWVRTHQQELLPPGTQQAPAVQLFGGYSSGGHVAVCLLQAPEKLKQWGLPSPAAGFDGVLLLSGVLGTRSIPPLPACTSAKFATDGLKSLLFGGDGATSMPSPLHIPERSPRVPHLLVHCKHEVFGLPLIEPALSHLLCTEAYAAALRARGVPTRVESVASDHWFVLSSAALRDVLRRALLVDRFGAQANGERSR